MSAQPHLTTLPAGVVLPSDERAAREVIERELEQAEEEARSREFIDQLQRERIVEFAI